MSRTGNSFKNASFALISQLITTIISFVTRTALIKSVGIQAVSLNGLFSEVIMMLSLTEMGVGTAIVYNLYKPLAEGDQEKVRQLLKLFKKAYGTIALVTFALGVLLTPWIQYLVDDLDYTIQYIRIVYLLFIVQTAATYLFSYKTALLNADQKKYIISNITISVKAIGMILLLILLFTTHDYIIFLIGNITVNLTINIVASLVVDRDYPYLRGKGELPVKERKQVFSNIKSIFIRTLSGKITNSTDNILISTLVSTLLVGYYSNYSLFLNVVKQLGNQLIGGISGSLGNLLATSESEYSEVILKRLTFIFYSISLILCMGSFSCLSSVIEIWIGEEYILGKSTVFICCFVVFLEFAAKPLWEIMTASGLFKKDKNISIAGSTINLIISILLGKVMGINGIFIGTLCTYIIQIVFKSRLLYKDKFKKSVIQYYIMWFKMSMNSIALMAVIAILEKVLVINNSYISILTFGSISVGFSLFGIWVLFHRSDEFHYTVNLIKTGIVSLMNKKTSLF